MDSPSNKRPSELANYYDLFGRMLDAVVLLEVQRFEILETNAFFDELFEVEEFQMVRAPVVELVEESRRPEFLKSLRMVRRKYYPRRFESVWKLPDGRLIPVEILVCGLQLSNGEPIIQLVARDMSRIKELHAKLESLSITDDLTGLSNIRHFKAELAREHNRADRYRTPYSIIFCDVDHFKNYNDRQGHQAGDEVLKRIARVIRASCRKTDLPARYGGDEFIILCAETSEKEALQVANRIRTRVEGHPFEFAAGQPLGRLTVSIGVAGYPSAGTEQDLVLRAADEATYAAKSAGRNGVMLFSSIKKAKAA